MSRNSKRRRATKIAGEATRLIENSIATFNAEVPVDLKRQIEIYFHT